MQSTVQIFLLHYLDYKEQILEVILSQIQTLCLEIILVHFHKKNYNIIKEKCINKKKNNLIKHLRHGAS